ncbi:hypothetical protein LTR62_006668 [Meristemomyces frigidus]|uniref:Uncharacterized protein n=1 Tax=Meristemomyces frigidus TaxID=1508187 RepID=A0AAN7THN7_9PEZI|nr:hypothetical protein LTR62_006668 [Meristemomyces frigidus]
MATKMFQALSAWLRRHRLRCVRATKCHLSGGPGIPPAGTLSVLPPELRLMIYDLVFDHNDFVDIEACDVQGVARVPENTHALLLAIPKLAGEIEDALKRRTLTVYASDRQCIQASDLCSHWNQDRKHHGWQGLKLLIWPADHWHRATGYMHHSKWCPFWGNFHPDCCIETKRVRIPKHIREAERAIRRLERRRGDLGPMGRLFDDAKRVGRFWRKR